MTASEPSERAEGPLHGIRVIELSSWVMAPACGAILAAYGADVIKVEPAGSADPSRGTRRVMVDGEPIEGGFELANNAKRGIQLDLGSDAAIEVLHRLLAPADVFLTNVRHAPLERAGIAAEALRARHPNLIIAHATGYGPSGRDSGRPAFDELAYWSRAGIAATLAADGDPPVQLQGALGDMPASAMLCAGILMALFRRERAGGGAIVDVSLYGAGLWSNGWALQSVLLGAPDLPARGRRHRVNPLYTNYRCADGRWVQFAMFQTERYWEPLCAALGRPELASDERFASHEALLAHSYEAVLELEQVVGSLTLDDLGPRLDERDLPWSPIFSLSDIVDDEQARANGYLVSKQHRSGAQITSIAPPFQLRGQELHFAPAPEVAQHQEEVLQEAGYDWDDIQALRRRGAF